MRQVRTAPGARDPQRPPLRLSVGQHVHAGERDGTWPEFVFVTAEHGSGWVPARHLSSDSGPVVVTTPYDTTELATRASDVLEVLEEDLQSGWLWCRRHDGQKGWVPINTSRTPRWPHQCRMTMGCRTRASNRQGGWGRGLVSSRAGRSAAMSSAVGRRLHRHGGGARQPVRCH
jgi:hypothetical protein